MKSLAWEFLGLCTAFCNHLFAFSLSTVATGTFVLVFSIAYVGFNFLITGTILAALVCPSVHALSELRCAVTDHVCCMCRRMLVTTSLAQCTIQPLHWPCC